MIPPAPPAPTSPADVAQWFRLDGHTALVTGGAGILGLAMARGLGLAGARVAITSRTLDKAVEKAGELTALGIDAVGVAMEATDETSVLAAVAAVESRLGPITTLINAAGGNHPAGTITPDRKLGELAPEAWRAVFDQNLLGGALLPSQIVGERMAARGTPGSIINVTSVAAVRPLTRVIAYSVAKAAVASLTQWLAVYYARDRGVPIRVNSLLPGYFLTEQNRYLLTTPEGGTTPRGQAAINQTPMGRYGDPHELVAACVYLAGYGASFVTGSTVTVDGGFTAFGGV